MKQVSSKHSTTFENEINSDNVEYRNNSSEYEQSDIIESIIGCSHYERSRA